MKNDVIQKYTLDKRSLFIKNGKGFYNRSMYYNGRRGYLTGGDYPAVKIIAGDYFYGSFFFTALDEEKGAYLFPDYETRYYPNRIEYAIGKNKELRISVLPASEGQGVCVKMSGEKQKVMIWWGGMHAEKNGTIRVRWDYDPGRNRQPLISADEQKELSFEQTKDCELYIKPQGPSTPG